MCPLFELHGIVGVTASLNGTVLGCRYLETTLMDSQGLISVVRVVNPHGCGDMEAHPHPHSFNSTGGYTEQPGD